VDNVLTAENKANTNALDVTFISYIPLISPLVDISNQAAVRFPVSFMVHTRDLPHHHLA
jgi:hypothetical protein